MLFASTSAFEETPYSVRFYNSNVLLNGDAQDEAKPAKKSGNGYPRPEKVQDLEPGTYTRISNMQGHVLNPFTKYRTAFYDKKNSLWREGSELV